MSKQHTIHGNQASKTMQNAPSSLKAFQRAYSTYLRDPELNTKPEPIPKRQSRVYEELLFNNVCGFINNCFPVCKSLFEGDDWLRIARIFYREWKSATPYFSKIPSEFVQFLFEFYEQAQLPDWMPELAHYEWVELEVDSHPGQMQNRSASLTLNSHLQLNSSLHNLAYRWPVHKISTDFKPDQPEAAFLLVFRTHQHKVEFMEVNAVTHGFLQLFIQSPSLKNNLDDLAIQLKHPSPQEIQAFGLQLCQDLHDKEVLWVI